MRRNKNSIEIYGVISNFDEQICIKSKFHTFQRVFKRNN